MITTCTECQARYQLDAEKIPPRVIKVRCPSCGGVFSLDGRLRVAGPVAVNCVEAAARCRAVAGIVGHHAEEFALEVGYSQHR